MLDEMNALEGKIVTGFPVTFAGLTQLLEMTYALLAARDFDRDSLAGCGPVAMLVARAAYAVSYCSGEINSRR